MTESKQQICIRMTSPAYKILTAITNKFKNESCRSFTNSTIINDVLIKYGPPYLNLSIEQQKKIISKYVEIRDREA